MYLCFKEQMHLRNTFSSKQGCSLVRRPLALLPNSVCNLSTDRGCSLLFMSACRAIYSPSRVSTYCTTTAPHT
jgi:hypothetical protein